MPRLSSTHRCGLAALFLLGACSGKKPEATPPAAAPSQASEAAGVAAISDAERMVLDSANNKFRAKDYQGALAGYRRAAAIAPMDVTNDIALGEEANREMTARGGAPGESDSAAIKAHQVPKPKPSSTIH